MNWIVLSSCVPSRVREFKTVRREYKEDILRIMVGGGRDSFNILIRYVLTSSFFPSVPDSAPPNIVLEKKSSTSIKVKWDTLSSLSLWNGIPAGYEVQFRLKDAGSSSWTSVVISERQYTTTGLLKYRIYEFKVAARTSKGSGVFSSIKEERTMEDSK